jgi:succinoglycan biosynthesis protein ExoM
MSEHMVVTVCTRERPNMLMACLRSVLPQLEAAEVQTSLVVVENDAVPKNRDAVLALGPQFPSVRIEYRLQPELGIPIARNTAVETALELGADWIFFVDDDEEACEGWFDAYLAAMREWDADVFRGPVQFLYPEDHPEWLRRHPFNGGASGSRIYKGGTENIVCKAQLFSDDGLGLRFDTRYRFTGGEDVDLFKRAVREKVKIIWLNEARMIERQFGIRLTPKWMLERSRAGAAFYASQMIERHSRWRASKFFVARLTRHTIHIGARVLVACLLFCMRSTRQRVVFSIRRKVSVMAGYLDAMWSKLPNPYS